MPPPTGGGDVFINIPLEELEFLQTGDALDNAGWTKAMARLVERFALNILVPAAFHFWPNLKRVSSATVSWSIYHRGTIFGLSTLFHCIAWVVIVGLIDQGRSDLLPP